MRVAVATLSDIWRHYPLKSWHPPRHEYARVVAETLAGRVAVGLDGDRPLAIGGVFRWHDADPGVCWLSVAPGLADRIVPAVLLMRRLIRHGDDGRGLICEVEAGNAEGARLARMLGFTITDRSVGSLREWRYEHSDRGDGKETIQPRA